VLDPQPVRDSPETPSLRTRNAVTAPAPAAAWRADVLAGVVGSVVTLASWLTLPLLAFVALGP